MQNENVSKQHKDLMQLMLYYLSSHTPSLVQHTMLAPIDYGYIPSSCSSSD